MKEDLENSVERVMTLIEELQKRKNPKKENDETITPFLIPCLRLSLAQVDSILKEQKNSTKKPTEMPPHTSLLESSQRSTLVKTAQNAQKYSHQNDFQSYLYKVWASVEKTLKGRILKGWNLNKETYALQCLKQMGLHFFSYDEKNFRSPSHSKLHLIPKKTKS